MEKKPVACKELCAEYWLKEFQESMDRYPCRRDITEILLKNGVKQQTDKQTNSFEIRFNLSSANAFNLDQSKNLSFGKVLIRLVKYRWLGVWFIGSDDRVVEGVEQDQTARMCLLILISTLNKINL